MSSHDEYQNSSNEEEYGDNYQQETEGYYENEDDNVVSGEKRERDDDVQPYKRQRVDVGDRKIMVKSLSFDCRKEALFDIFKKYGQIEELKFPTFPDSGRSRGYAFIIYSDPDSAEKSFEANGTILGDRQLIVQKAIEKDPFSGTTREIFVGNLSFDATEDDIKAYFEKYGSVIEVRLPLNNMNKPKGFAYITFESVDDVKEALKANGTVFMEREIRVNEETHQEKRRSGGFRSQQHDDRYNKNFSGGFRQDRFGREGGYPRRGGRFGDGDRFGNRRGGFGGRRFDDRNGGRYEDRGDRGDRVERGGDRGDYKRRF